MRVVNVVCTGNLCRSPLGAALLEDRLLARGVTDVSVASAGTHAVVGGAVPTQGVSLARRAGLDVTETEPVIKQGSRLALHLSHRLADGTRTAGTRTCTGTRTGARTGGRRPPPTSRLAEQPNAIPKPPHSRR